MKMNFFFGNVFWGILLILWGVSLVLRNFNIYLPLAKVFFALMIILFGIKLLMGNRISLFSCSKSNRTYHGAVRSSGDNEYTMVFASGSVDLTGLSPDSDDIEISVVFGTAEVILPSHLKLNINPTAVFGQNILPKGLRGGGDKDNAVNIESNAVFGKIIYRIKDTGTPADIIEEPFEEENSGDF